jgi:HSP20 family protein
MNNNLTRYAPQSPAYRDEFLTSMDHVFDSVFREMFPQTTKEFLGLDPFTKGAYPKVDVRDGETQVTIEAEVPGLKKEQVTVEVQEGVLTIKGDKRDEKAEEKANTYLFKELKRSSFSRSFTLSDGLDSANIKAKFENGILEVVIPKKSPTPPSVRKVNVE